MLCLEGDTTVLEAVAKGKPGIKRLYTGGGMAGVTTTGLACWLEKHASRSSGTQNLGAVSVGGVNAWLSSNGVTRKLASMYHKKCCSCDFIRKSFISWLTGGKVDLTYLGRNLLDAMKDQSPTHADNQLHFFTTDYDTGESVVLQPDPSDTQTVLLAVLASAQLPFVGKGYIEIEGRRLTDGGVSNQIPALDMIDGDANGLLIVMPQSEQVTVNRMERFKEMLYFNAVWWKMPKITREMTIERVSLYRRQLAGIRNFAQKSRVPICIVWPNSRLPLLEQSPAVIEQAEIQSREDWKIMMNSFSS